MVAAPKLDIQESPPVAPASPPIERIVVLVLDSLHSAVALHQFVEVYGDRIACIVSSEKIRGVAGEGLIKETIKYWRKSGIAYLLYLSAMQLLFKPCAYMAGLIARLGGWHRRAFTLGEVARRYGIDVIRTRDVNSPQFVRQISEIKPDLFVLLYFDQILKDPLIALPKRGVLNTHPGLLPANRGPTPSFWAIRLKHVTVGATVHMIDSSRIDAGPIVAIKAFPRDPLRSVVGLDCEAMRAGAELAIQAVAKIEAGEAVPIPQDEGVHGYHRDPGRKEIREFRRDGGRLFRISDFFVQFLE
jgi:methionyl-tRNA formyltransferase